MNIGRTGQRTLFQIVSLGMASLVGLFLFLFLWEPGSRGSGLSPDDRVQVSDSLSLLEKDIFPFEPRCLEGCEVAAIVSPDDCPSCYEATLSELNLLSLEVKWKGRTAAYVVGNAQECAQFKSFLTHHYNFLFPLHELLGGRDGIPNTRPRAKTPSVLIMDANGRIERFLHVDPTNLSILSVLFDSLRISRAASG